MRYFKISEEELTRLIERDNELLTLENMGVDNWEGYGMEPDWEDDEDYSTYEYIVNSFEEIE